MGKLFGVLAMLALEIPALMLRGFVLSMMWLWFAVPLGAPVIGAAWALGIAVLISLLTHNPQAVETDDDEKNVILKMWNRIVVSATRSLVLWGYAAIVHAVMVN